MRKNLIGLKNACLATKMVFNLIFLAFILASFFIKSMYRFNDFPYFTLNNLIDLLFFVTCIGLLAIMLKFSELMDKILDKRLITVFFLISGIVFIYLMPLKPFSDMQQVYNAAIALSNFKFSEVATNVYFNQYPNNLLISIIFGFILLISCKSLVALKIFNLVLIILSAWQMTLILKALGCKQTNLYYFLTLCFLPVFLYINHIYSDVLFSFVCLLGIYLYIKNYCNAPISFGIFAFAYFLRPLSIIFAIVILIDLLFHKREKKAFYVFISFLIFIVIFISFTILTKMFLKLEIKSYPIWSFLYIGINEPRFGFMDGTYSVDRKLSDIIQRLQGYGIIDTFKILIKKSFWMWTEGTYQAQRYAFSLNGTNVANDYYFTTILTPHLQNGNQVLSKCLNAFMRAEYIIAFSLMFVSLFIGKAFKKINFLYLLFLGYFLFYLAWEIKSRYIFSLYPYMLIFAFLAIEKIKMRMIHKNTKENL